MKKILVVAHDAGGANILCSLVKRYQRDFNWRIYVFGPAKRVFSSSKVSADSLTPLDDKKIKDLVRSIKFDLLLTGTSYPPGVELKFIKLAKKNRRKTASFLDHWTFYQQRFGSPSQWRKNLPEFILVSDKWAYETALKRKFPQEKIFQVENPYFCEMIKKADQHHKRKADRKKSPKREKIKLLYLSQFITKVKKDKDGQEVGDWQEVEAKIIADLRKILQMDEFKNKLDLKVRLHPAETARGVFASCLISDPNKNSLIKDCLWADMALASETMALVVAVLMGKRAVSYLPTSKKCRLPQKEIIKIKTRKKLVKVLKGMIESNFGKIKRVDYDVNQKLFTQAVKKILSTDG